MLSTSKTAAVEPEATVSESDRRNAAETAQAGHLEPPDVTTFAGHETQTRVGGAERLSRERTGKAGEGVERKIGGSLTPTLEEKAFVELLRTFGALWQLEQVEPRVPNVRPLKRAWPRATACRTAAKGRRAVAQASNSVKTRRSNGAPWYPIVLRR